MLMSQSVRLQNLLSLASQKKEINSVISFNFVCSLEVRQKRIFCIVLSAMDSK